MKTLVLTSIRNIELAQRPKPEINSPEEVLIKILSVGVCGSDVHYFTDGKIGFRVFE